MILRKHKFYRLFVLVLFPLAGFSATSPDSLFKKGNEAYTRGHYEEAITSYAQLVDSGYRQFELYYNLGNANYKAGNVAGAILNYERAKKLDPGNEDVAINLDFANKRIVDKIEGVPEFFLKKWWINFTMIFNIDIWAGITAVLFIAGFVLLIVYLLSTASKIKRISFYSGILLLVFSIGVLAVTNSQQSYFDTHKQAIVLNGTVNVKSAPNEKQKTLFIIHEGTKITVMDNVDSWVKVALPNGGIGWIPSNAIELI